MGLFDDFDFKNGQLPPWLAPLVELTRPMATTMTALIIPAGAFTVAMVATFSPETALAMASASTTFMAGIPEPIVWMIGGILGASFVSSSAEVIKAPGKPAHPARPDLSRVPDEYQPDHPTVNGEAIDPENMPPR